MLEPIFKAQPDHPGVAHYLIHSYDYPPIAKHGVEAAQRIRQDRAGRRRTRCTCRRTSSRGSGYWQRVDRGQPLVVEAAGDATFDGHHASDYMVYAHLQLAQDGAAREAMEQSRAHEAGRQFRRRLRLCRDAGAPRARARRLGGGG